MCGIIICGVSTQTKAASKPNGCCEPPENIICPFCTFRGKARFVRRVTYFTLFFIPLCPVKYNETYLACPSCGIKLGKFSQQYCKNCRTATAQSYSHCVRCGCDLSERDNRVTG